jgi:hypothetical protein
MVQNPGEDRTLEASVIASENTDVIGDTHRTNKNKPIKELVRPLRADHSVVLRFASGICGYYISYGQESDGFVVIYGGPNGPENRPAHINKRNLSVLQKESEQIEYLSKEETPFSSE